MANWDKRLESKAWRLTHLYKIKNKLGELVTFKPNQIQLRHAVERGAHRYNRILKARQFGFTTFYCIDLLDEALWVPGMSCGIIAHEAKKLPEYFDIVKRAYENMPPVLLPKTKTDTKNRYDFVERFDGLKLDSSIFVAVKLRGGTVQNLHITEIAYIKDQQELKSGSKQSVPKGGRISEETTANGFNEFYDDFTTADSNPNPGEYDYRAYFYAWWENDEYSLPGTIPEVTPEDIAKYGNEADLRVRYGLTDGQLLWRRWKIRELASDTEKAGLGLSGMQLFRQEYPASKSEAFQSGAGSVFDAEAVDAIVLKKPITDLEVQEQRPELYTAYKALCELGVVVWKLPEVGKKYVIGVDPSDGTGADSSCIDVWEKEETKQVAQFYGKVRPDVGAEITKEIAEFYNRAFTGVENNMLSWILSLSAIYDNYYFTNVMDEKTQKKTKKIGWRTDSKSRNIMINDFIELFEEGYLKVNSPITQREMKTFVKNEAGKREHAVGKHDDALFGGFIAMQMRKFYREPPRTFRQKPF